jgi:serine/threonine-protein kinase RsbW
VVAQGEAVRPLGWDDADVELEIPARAEYVSLARLVVSSLASSRRDLPDDRIDDLKLAVSEACTNAIEAYEPAGEERVVLRWRDGQDHFEVDVQDQGPGFDPSTLPERPSVTDPVRPNFERGLGVPLMRALVDRVEFASSDDGTSVTMMVYCPPVAPGGQ